MKTATKNLRNWWRRRTILERCLTLVSVFACSAINGFTTGATLNKEPASNKDVELSLDSKQSNVCLLEECRYTASAVLSKMKPEIKPCDDFYQFACGNFSDKTEIPTDQSVVNTLSIISGKLNQQVKNIITQELPDTEPKHLKLPNLLYKACMNTTLIESLGGQPIKEISDSVGGWPVLMGNAWDKDNTWSWQKTIAKLKRLGFGTSSLVYFAIAADYKNSTKRIIDLDQPTLGLSREYLVKGFNESFVSAYFDYMVDMAVFFGAEKETAKEELKESLQFEIDLANITWPKEKRRNFSDSYNLRTVKQLQESYPYVQWLDYINDLLPASFKIDENEIINLSVPSFFAELGKLLQRTKKRVIANYMMWRIYDVSVAYLSEELRNIKLRYETVLTGKKEQKARGKECVNTVLSSLSIAVGSLYVRKHFQQDSKAIALEMVENLRSVFSQLLDDVKWMDQKTKQEAKKKLHAMTSYIGYPNEMIENDKLEEFYRKLEVDPDKYFQSVLNTKIFEKEYAINKFRLPINKTEWVRHAQPAVVNAFYSSIENSIVFPAGILQGHVFHAQRPKYMNYGGIGYVIGHEITHGFDDQGRQFDLEGNLIDWWQPDTRNAYLEKAKCIIEQYGNYTDKQTGLNLNGVSTQGENTADNGGIKESYLAYNQWVAKHGEEPTLPGLNYTPNQMFWISAAQVWCAKYRTEHLEMAITTGVHSPDEFRVLGSFRNMRDFSRDFQCPEGSPMNPAKKCEVW